MIKGHHLGLGMLILMLSSLTNAQLRYDGYFNAVTGSSRIIGLGGAHRAVATGIEAGILNPAGVSRQKDWYDGTFSFGSFQFSNGLNADSEKVQYLYLGSTFKIRQWRNFGFGLILSSPTTFSFSGSAPNNTNVNQDYTYDFSRVSLAIPLSISIRNNLQIGFRIVAISAVMEFESNGIAIEDQTIGNEFDIGIQYQPTKQWYTSINYQPKRTLIFENKNTSVLKDFTPFLETAIPHQLFLGGGFIPNDRWLFALDIGYISSLDNAVFPGTELSSFSSGVTSGNKNAFQYHMGAEHIIKPGRWEARIGHYFQPARAQGDINRFHATGGLDYYFWYVKLGTSFDVAKNYWNYSFSVTPNFSGHKKRSATKKKQQIP